MRQRIEALCRCGLAIVVATSDEAGAPAITRGWGARLDRDRERLIVPITAPEGSPTAARLGVGHPISVTLSEMPTYSTVQVNGEVAEVRPPTREELELADGHLERFVEAAGRLGIESGAERLYLADLVAVEVAPHQLFEQTPGPTAGDALGDEGVGTA